MSGCTLHLFPTTDDDLESLPDEEAQLRQRSRNILKALWKETGKKEKLSLFSWQYLTKLWQDKQFLFSFYQAIFVKNDAFFLRAARLEVANALKRLLNQLQTIPIDPCHEKQIQMAIGNILSIYAVFSPHPDEHITIPIKQDSGWVGVKYQQTPLELTAQKGFWSIFFDEENRLFSYGLSPVDNNDAPSFLLHSGTAWPSAQGSLAQYIADIWPFKTPGEIFFDWGMSPVNRWLDAKPNKSVITAGMSLGGSLSYLTACHRPEKIKSAHCLNPPGMAHNYGKSHKLFGAWEKTDDKPTVNIERQQEDIISKCGVFKKEFTCNKVSIPNHRQHKNVLLRFGLAHAKSYACFDNVHIANDVTIEAENRSAQRKKNNFYLYKIARVFFFFFVLFPFSLIIRPIINFISKHAFELLIFGALIALMCTVPPFTTILGLSFIPWLGSGFLSSLLPAFIGATIISNAVFILHDLFTNFSLKLTDFIQEFKQASFKTRLFYISNIMTLGLLSMCSNIINAVLIHPIKSFFKKREELPEIFSKEAFDKLEDFNNQSKPSFATKLQVTSLIILFYLVVTPIKLLFYDLPKKLLSCCFSSDDDDPSSGTSSAEDKSHHTKSSKKNRGGFKLFQCFHRRESNKIPITPVATQKAASNRETHTVTLS